MSTASGHQSDGISHAGKSAEERFRELTGAEKSPAAAMGDAVLDGIGVEIKKASSNTINQVRAVKYIPLVVLDDPSDQWYVVPAHEVVRQVAVKSRGQHTEIPFECATLSLKNVASYAVSAADLRAAGNAAAQESAR
jgi:hypothetical protein